MTDAGQPTLRLYPSADTLFADLSDMIAGRLTKGIAERGAASLVTSGGSTPGALYDLLSAEHIDWSRVSVTASDERWVPQGTDGSNEKLVRDRLLVNRAASASYVGLRTAADTPVAAEAETHDRIAALPRPFDVTLVGMGPDSHTASLYPHAQGLERALDLGRDALTAAVTPLEAVGSNQRLSLTLKALLDSRLIVILIRGEDKLAVYREALAGSDVLAAPVRALLHQASTPVEVWWAP